MTDDDIVNQGDAARVLLENPLIVGAFGGFMNEALQNILASKDDEQDYREKQFRQMRTYENVLTDLRSRVEQADQVLAARVNQATQEIEEED